MFSAEASAHAINFIEMLKHTKGKWHGVNFELLDWQLGPVSDIFGTLKSDGYRQFNTAYLEVPKKNGKQLALSTPIPTPTGFTTMGKLKVGEQVMDEKGSVCNVIAMSPVDDTEQAYKVNFRDGTTIVAGERHLWQVEVKSNGKREKSLTTGEMYEKQNKASNKDNRALFRIRIADAFILPENDLPIDPYLYGYWLGNGSAAKPEITVMRDDAEAVIVNIPYPLHNRYPQEGYSDILVYKELNNILVSHFKAKRIPNCYLRASLEQRQRLLQGLMDSDGCVSKSKGQAIYVTILPKLAEDMQNLLWSLGIKNSVKTTPSQRLGVPTGETCYLIRFTAFDDYEVSALDRKMTRAKVRNNHSRSHYHYIKSIEKTEPCPMRCIQVDSPSRLYLAGPSMIPTHNSELAAAVALLMTCGDGEQAAEVYGCASDRAQASIVFDVAVDMVGQCPALKKRIKPVLSMKRLVYLPTRSFYQVCSAEAYSKHGLNVHSCIFDELHAQPNRDLFDVMTKGSGDARTQPLFFVITTAGDDPDRRSIGWEIHKKAADILTGAKVDPTWYVAIYGIDPDENRVYRGREWETVENLAAPDKEKERWRDPKIWTKVNPSIGVTFGQDKVQEMYQSAENSEADERTFRWLRLNEWTKYGAAKWLGTNVWDGSSCGVLDPMKLKRRPCYGGLDLSSKTDITAFVLYFPAYAGERAAVLPTFWIPEDTIAERFAKDKVPYPAWVKQGFIDTTPGNVIDQAFIRSEICRLKGQFDIREIGFDPWNANQIALDLTDDGLTMVEVRQGFKTLSPAMRELEKLLVGKELEHGGNPVLRWMFGNLAVKKDENDNIRPVKDKSTERIDGIVALVNALARATLAEAPKASKYETEGIVSV